MKKFIQTIKGFFAKPNVMWSYFTFKNYRIKEYNSTYDFHFGEGRGWIYCTNEMTKFKAQLKLYFNLQSGWFQSGITNEKYKIWYGLEKVK